MRVFNDGGLVAFTFRHTAAVGRGGNGAAEGLGTEAPGKRNTDF